jgi:hypothetical protein
MFLTKMNDSTSPKITLRLAAAIVSGFLTMSAVHANDERDSCVRNPSGEKYLVVCKDGVFSEDITTQSLSSADATSEPSRVPATSRRFRYEDF